MGSTKGDGVKGIKQAHMQWAAKNLPNEYQPFVAVAYDMMNRHGIETTPESVRQRLIDSGRDRETLIERHKRYGSTKRTA